MSEYFRDPSDLMFSSYMPSAARGVQADVPLESSEVIPEAAVDLKQNKAVQAVIVDADWAENPVSFKEFCESTEHQNLLPPNWKEGEEGGLSDRQYYDCEKMLGIDPKRMFDPKYREYTFGAFLWGKGSGKDWICSIIQAYLVYVLLCMRNPQAFFGFPTGETCDILNVGQKGTQARRVYFTKFRDRLLNWKWLKARYNIFDEDKKVNWLGKTAPSCKLGKDFAEFKDKKVRAFSESANPEGFEGYNIVFYVCDEISGWVSPAERAVAEKMLKILQSSQVSRNTKSLCGLGMAISYPRQDDDIMFTFRKEWEKKTSRTYWSEAYAWNVKPKRLFVGDTFDFNSGTEELPEIEKIPVEYKDEFVKDPEGCKCRYLLKPPAVAAPFFEHAQRIDGIAQDERGDLFKVETDYIEAVDKTGSKIIYVRKVLVGLARQPDPGVDYVFWLDAAESNCDAALSIGHKELITLEEAGRRVDYEVVILDQTVVWEPDQKKKWIVDIGSMTTFCIKAKDFITIGGVFWDMWNSGTGIFDLRNAGILCDKHNLTGADYTFFKSIIYTSRFVGPNVPTTKKGIDQIKHLGRTRTNNVEPSSKLFKKDVADTWCGITALLLGSLVDKTFRAGRMPTGASLGAGISAGMSTGYAPSAAGPSASNPFSGPMSMAGRAIIKDHSDMFPGLPSLSKGRVRPSGSKPAPNMAPGNRRMPTGITL